MADPAPIAIIENQWIKFATAVTTGFIRRPPWDNASSFKFHWTSRDTGGAAPDDNDETDNGLSMVLFEKGNQAIISSVADQDFYVYAKNANADDARTTTLRADL